MYLLFKAIRQRSTVALSGESADEIFGGYRQLHDPQIQQTDAFPWVAIGASWTDASGYILTPALRTAHGAGPGHLHAGSLTPWSMKT